MSGSHLDTTYNRLARARARLIDLYSSTRIYRRTFKSHLEAVAEFRLMTDYAKLPFWAKRELEGYADCLSANMKINLMFCYRIDGQIVDAYTIDYASLSADQMAQIQSQSGHGEIYWKGTDKLWY